MPPEPAVWWLRTALGDLAAARALVDIAGAAPRHAAYLAQQGAEKALKATIALGGDEPPMTHDLLFLIRRSPGEAGLRDVLGDMVALSAVQTAARYPEPDDPPYDLQEAKHLVADAARLVVAVQEYFDRLGLAGTGLTPV
ncbi:MAG: HEPN domain-containing protein [Chloroflexota bacterium]